MKPQAEQLHVRNCLFFLIKENLSQPSFPLKIKVGCCNEELHF